jgi:hypothetical protein
MTMSKARDSSPDREIFRSASERFQFGVASCGLTQLRI